MKIQLFNITTSTKQNKAPIPIKPIAISTIKLLPQLPINLFKLIIAAATAEFMCITQYISSEESTANDYF